MFIFIVFVQLLAVSLCSRISKPTLDVHLYRSLTWGDGCKDRDNIICHIGTQGPCDPGQTFEAIPKNRDFSLDEAFIHCYNNHNNRNHHPKSIPTNCKLMDDIPFTFHNFEQSTGYCKWTHKGHPCEGYPTSYIYVEKRNQCLLPSSLKENLCKQTQIVQRIGNSRWTCGCREFQILWPRTGNCYAINSQGPCKRGQWLEVDRQGKAICRPTQCPADGLHIQQVNPQTKEIHCFTLGHQGPCPPNNSLVRIDLYTVECQKHLTYSAVAVVGNRKCPDGEMADVNGNCKTRFGR